MKLEDIRNEMRKLAEMYEVRDGIIRSPGKFEGEPVWVPYLYGEHPNDSLFDETNSELLVFEINDEEKKAFPELGGVDYVVLQEDDLGFVHKRTMTRPEFESLERKLAEQEGLAPSL